MHIKQLLYTGIILFPFLMGREAKAQQTKERHRSVTINQTVVDGKVIASDTIITYTDTTTRTINSKEVSIEMPYTKGTSVTVENIYRKINIRQAKDNKVRLVTTTFYYGEPTLTNEQWLEKLNIKMEKSDKGILVSSGTINQVAGSSNWSTNSNQVFSYGVPVPPTPPSSPGKITTSTPGMTVTTKGAFKEVITPGMTVTTNGAYKEVKTPGKTTTTFGPYTSVRTNGNVFTYRNDTIGNGPAREIFVNGQGVINEARSVQGYGSSSVGRSTAVFDENGNNVYNSSSLRRELTIYIPEGAKLNVESKYGNIGIDYDVADLTIEVNNATLEMLNAKKLAIRSSYGNILTGNVDDATIELKNGKLSMRNVNSLLMDTRYAQIEADKIGTLKIRSISDDYDINEVQNLSGTKTYGKLRLDKLTSSLNLEGSSADLKIRNVAPSVSSVILDNKYADIQLPVIALKNYEVSFSGNYNSVFAPFERRDTTLTTNTADNQGNPNQITIVTTGQGSSTTTYGSALAPLAKVKGLNTSRSNGQSFTAAVGDTKGTHTIFKLVCNSCNVDFK